MKTTTVASIAAAVGLVVGIGSGYAAAGEPETRTPYACTDMAETAIEAFQLWSDLATATRKRGDAPDIDTRTIHDAEVNHLLESLDAIAPEYDDAADDCVGAS